MATKLDLGLNRGGAFSSASPFRLPEPEPAIPCAAKRGQQRALAPVKNTSLAHFLLACQLGLMFPRIPDTMSRTPRRGQASSYRVLQQSPDTHTEYLIPVCGSFWELHTSVIHFDSERPLYSNVWEWVL